MASRDIAFTVHPANKGLDISSDPTVLDPSLLTAATNVEYLEGGQRKKRLGYVPYSTAAVKSSDGSIATTPMVSSTSNVRAFADIWMYGNSLTPTQNYVAVVGASIFRSTGNGAWAAVTTTSSFGVNANETTCLVQGLAVTSSGIADAVIASDGSSPELALMLATTTTLRVVTTNNTGTASATAWPVYESAVYHQERMWMLGLSTAPSDIRYTAAGNVMDSTGTDSGALTIDRGDGDRVIGASQTFFGSIYIFKGPQKGSVHQIAGNTSTSYTKSKIITGAPVQDFHNIVTTPTDIYWISRYGVHSLQTTVKFGNIEQAFLSSPIQTFWRNQLMSIAGLTHSPGFWNPDRNIVGWLVVPTGATTRTAALVYNYGLSNPAPGGDKYWSYWQFSQGMFSCNVLLNTTGGLPATLTGEPHLYLGGINGVLYMADYNLREVNGAASVAAITSVIQTPTITRFQSGNGVIPETQEKQFMGVVTYFNPQNQGACVLDIVIDGRQQEVGFTMTAQQDLLA